MTATPGLPGVPLPPAGPLVLPRHSYDELFDTAAQLLALVRRAVLAPAPSWPERLVALGADPADQLPHSGLETTETDCCTLLAGADFVVGEAGPWLVGLDTGAALGVPHECEALPEQGGEPLFGYDPRAARAEALADLCARRGLPPAVALIGPGFHPDEAQDLRDRGFTADLVDPGRLPGALGRPGRLRYALGMLGTRQSGGTDPAPVRHAQRAGLLLLPPFSSGLLADKRALALVSEGLPWMTRGERALVERRLPWTRITLAGRTGWHGTEQQLPDLLLAHRERFILKRAVSGTGPVLVGHETDDRTWTTAIRRAFEQADSVVQEHVRPAASPLVLRTLLFGNRPGGCHLRHPPRTVLAH
ncbi:hypothetical protein ACQEU8_26675 [Streptomyces sp. CA-250714]|uniref:hypothetical protein n=1 Tax=Streptomyces sp. CA-250714 TaxID=3240060 RepID=UPI003D8C95FB